MISFKKKKVEESLFKRDTYIPKKRLEKKERSVQSGIYKKARVSSVKPSGTGKKALIFLLWTFFIGEIGYTLFFAHFFTIQKLTLEREGETQTLSLESIQTFLSSSWSGEWLPKFSKDNLLFVQPSLYEEKIKERFPKIDRVNVVRHFPESLEVTFTEKAYQILWCKKEDCFLVNSIGKLTDAGVFFQKQDEQGRTIRIEDTADESVALGSQVLEESDLEFINNLETDFALRTGFKPFSVLERPHAQAQELRLQTEKGFTIFFNSEAPVAESLNNLMLVLQKEIPEAEWEKIEYIDLRTKDRVYYTREDKAPEKTEEQIRREDEEKKKAEPSSLQVSEGQ